MPINRRALLKSALAAGVVGATKPIFGYRDGGGGMFGYEPFTQPFFKPPVIHKGTSLDPMPGTPEASLGSDAVYHGVAPEYYPAHPADVQLPLVVHTRGDRAPHRPVKPPE